MFSTPELIVFDTLRIVAALASLATIALTPYAVTKRIPWHQRARMIGLALTGSAIIVAYLQSLGTVPTAWWRLVAITAGVVLGMVGMLAFLRDHRRQSMRPTTSRHGR